MFGLDGENMDIRPEQAQSSLALNMDNASLNFGGGAGVFDLNFSLPQGSILGMIGPSGCGKTTTIRLLNGIYGPTSGDVRVFGKQPLKFDQADKARIGYIPQQFILYPILRARIWENFRELRDQVKTLLVTTQYVGEALRKERTLSETYRLLIYLMDCFTNNQVHIYHIY